MRLATISNWASARSQGRATSCRRYARDDTRNRNPYSCQYAPAISSPHAFAHEKPFHAAGHHRATLAYPPRADVGEYPESSATRIAPAQEINSANPQRIPFGSEIPASENDRVLPVQRDQESNLQSQHQHAGCLVVVGKRRREDSPTENVNPVKLR